MERELARITSCDVGYEDHGCPVMFCNFDYESGGGQGLGCIIDMAFILRFLNAVGEEKLHDCIGKSVWVTHDHSSISIIEPLHKKDGKTFIISEWGEWVKKYCPYSASQMLGEMEMPEVIIKKKP